jgi:hypothetical protein
VKRRCGRGLRFHRVDFRISQYVRRLLGHATHARDVQEEAEVSRGRHERQSFRIALSDRRCILALRGLSSPASSRHGNFLGMTGMAIAIVTMLAAHLPSGGVG